MAHALLTKGLAALVKSSKGLSLVVFIDMIRLNFTFPPGSRNGHNGQHVPRHVMEEFKQGLEVAPENARIQRKKLVLVALFRATQLVGRNGLNGASAQSPAVAENV